MGIIEVEYKKQKGNENNKTIMKMLGSEWECYDQNGNVRSRVNMVELE